MNHRDQIRIGSQSILWVAGVGVGLLTLAFVLGVQVGKQSAALRRPMQKGVEDELNLGRKVESYRGSVLPPRPPA